MNRHSSHERSDLPFPSDQYQKEVWPGATLLAPVPIVMVTTQVKGGKPNICTIAWTGIVCSNPPMLSISLQPSRHSFPHLMEQKEFVVNIPPRHLARETDMCGVISGRDEDKFEKTHLTPMPSKNVLPPLIRECPVNLECRVTKVIELGSHHMFIAEIVRVHVQKKLINETGRLALEKAKLLSYAHGHYYAIGIRIGRYGFSVRKRQADGTTPVRKVKEGHEAGGEGAQGKHVDRKQGRNDSREASPWHKIEKNRENAPEDRKGGDSRRRPPFSKDRRPGSESQPTSSKVSASGKERSPERTKHHGKPSPKPRRRD